VSTILVKKKPAEAGPGLFLLRGISYPRQPKRPMRTVRRLLLRFCFYDRVSPVLTVFTLPCCLFQ